MELQNEQLCQSQILLEESHDRYFNLYEFAPVGYFTVTIEGIILSCNFTGAELFRVSDRLKLVNRRFASFIMPEDLEHWNLYFIRAKQNHGKQGQNIQLKIKQTDDTLFHARLDTQQLL